MLSDDILKEQLKNTLDKTNLNIGKKYEGKVRDSYVIDNKRLIITTDRISAFDRVLCTLPFKGQVLNQTAAFWFEKTKDIVKNHVIEIPDPNVLVAKECELIPVEMVIRGYLTGVTTTSAWYNYEKGIRNFCGNILPEGMEKNQKFEKPIITPSTKAEKGAHDESISGEEIVKRGLVDENIYKKMESVALALYNFGNQYVAKNNLILVDTKYEFGLLDGELILIDEIHTPDSSRFWVKDTYDELFSNNKEPQKLDKEYVRQWLADKGFIGEGKIPSIPDEVKIEAAKRYITAYEMITGKDFKAKDEDILARIENNLKKI
ncbi:MAG: phosphoribosylaminoimidazolesuccinocarboxamide synthase [Candidatus Woesearchaeota archaeon]|jgi:phosphoribosylaminoimidazole-succinocarboxamide synthase|nr:phosphoribosylaminoimidazolesuccinocarboxamide synthase [Candidatus Woesearchaeota archaeon]MDP7622949.1 phosphoribosylaminoimidazolesuccinocarboxamide synthase [Candidatus Woesearchaeota archaeon]HJN57384.1 phosphoribosylaminoimidazolesuccinocarboxamide synthase [Candidatus Woesearchaeota archaeon]|tara:strand:+ start:10788 stop:11744 length:957 start_codon:yes stop_codon:yes gene_type:complete